MSLSRYSSSALLLLLSSNGFGFANGQDIACGNAIESATLAVFGDVCDETGGICPDSCASLFRDLHDTCTGKSYEDSLGDVLQYDPSVALGVGVFVSGACEDTPLSVLFERDDIPCEDWLDVNSFMAFLSCSDECTDACKRVIDKLYVTCEATDEKTDDFLDDDFFVTTAEEAEQDAASFRHEDCNAYADGLEWKTEGAVEVLTTTSSPTTPSVSIPASSTFSPFPTLPPTASSVSIPVLSTTPPTAPPTIASVSLSLSTTSPTTSPTMLPTRGPVVAVTAAPVSSPPTVAPTVLPTSSPTVAPTTAAPTTNTAPIPLQLAPVCPPSAHSSSASASLSSMWGLISASSIFIVCLVW